MGPSGLAGRAPAARRPHPGRQLRLRGAKLEAELDAGSQIEVAMDLYLDNGFQAPGDVHLAGGAHRRTAGPERCETGRRPDRRHAARRSSHLVRAHDGARLYLSLRKARLAELTFTDAILLGTPRGLLLRDAQIDGALVMHFAMAPVGLVVLTSAQMTTLYEQPAHMASSRALGRMRLFRRARRVRTRPLPTPSMALAFGLALPRWRGGDPGVESRQHAPARRLRWIRRRRGRRAASSGPLATGARPRRRSPRTGARRRGSVALGAAGAGRPGSSTPPQPYTHLSKLYPLNRGRDGGALVASPTNENAGAADTQLRLGGRVLEPVPALDRRLRLQAAASARLASASW